MDHLRLSLCRQILDLSMSVSWGKRTGGLIDSGISSTTSPLKCANDMNMFNVSTFLITVAMKAIGIDSETPDGSPSCLCFKRNHDNNRIRWGTQTGLNNISTNSARDNLTFSKPYRSRKYEENLVNNDTHYICIKALDFILCCCLPHKFPEFNLQSRQINAHLNKPSKGQKRSIKFKMQVVLLLCLYVMFMNEGTQD